MHSTIVFPLSPNQALPSVPKPKSEGEKKAKARECDAKENWGKREARLYQWLQIQLVLK